MSNASVLWQQTDFFKGFLTTRSRFRQLRFVVLGHSKHNFNSSISPPGSVLDLVAGSAEGTLDASVAPVHPFASPNGSTEPETFEFYMYSRCDVSPPAVKYISEPDKVDRCFLVCKEPGPCHCHSLHPRPGAWSRRLDTLVQTSPLVCFNENDVIRLLPDQVQPTAGYYYALGLRAEGLSCVFPRVCSLGLKCTSGSCCLYIHVTSTFTTPTHVLSAETPLLSLRSNPSMSGTLSQMLQARSLTTVGDIQMMSKDAFEALVGQAPSEELEELLSISTCRFFDEHSHLSKVLQTFPHLSKELPPPLSSFTLVSDVLKLTTTQLYSCPLPPEFTHVLEVIRKRIEPDDVFQCIYLEDLYPDAFAARALQHILTTAAIYAHPSWRRHDVSRPVVSSFISFVDVTACRCGSTDSIPENFCKDLPHYAENQRERIAAPYGSWCECPRMWEVAVNYELNTPMGSRCSEQNVMAAIARSGAPTWSIREVVVHGNKPNHEVNPLFPCGVCENMLRKVEKDVRAYYGKSIMLYMFDATKPTKVFSLPFREISLRDNPRFNRVVAAQ